MATQTDTSENPLRDSNNVDIEPGRSNTKNSNRRHTR